MTKYTNPSSNFTRLSTGKSFRTAKTLVLFLYQSYNKFFMCITHYHLSLQLSVSKDFIRGYNFQHRFLSADSLLLNLQQLLETKATTFIAISKPSSYTQTKARIGRKYTAQTLYSNFYIDFPIYDAKRKATSH